MTSPEKQDTEEIEIKEDKRNTRKTENFFFKLGGGIVALYAISETLHRIGWKIGPCGADVLGVPWGVIIVCGIMMLPKIAGRASAGRIYEALAKKVGIGS